MGLRLRASARAGRPGVPKQWPHAAFGRSPSSADRFRSFAAPSLRKCASRCAPWGQGASPYPRPFSPALIQLSWPRVRRSCAAPPPQRLPLSVVLLGQPSRQVSGPSPSVLAHPRRAMGAPLAWANASGHRVLRVVRRGRCAANQGQVWPWSWAALSPLSVRGGCSWAQAIRSRALHSTSSGASGLRLCSSF